jgi:dihydroxy-acid dehydratase
MTLDIAMGGSTNTILHLLAAPRKRVSTSPWPTSTASRASCPSCARWRPTRKYHIEDVHRAGGIMAILGELDRAGKLHTDVPTVHAKTMADALDQWDIVRTRTKPCALLHGRPAGIPTQVAFSQNTRWPSLDLDRAEGCIRSYEHAFARKAAWPCCGNIALDGCVVKTAGVDEHPGVRGGPRVEPGRSRGQHPGRQGQGRRRGHRALRRPQGRPGMQEMLYPTSYIKSKGLGKACALLTDGRFSGGTSGLSIGHCSPEAAAGGAIGLVQNGDRIRIDIPNRSINVLVSDEELARRRAAQNAKGWKPAGRPRKVSGPEGLRQAGDRRRQGRRARPVAARRLSYVCSSFRRADYALRPEQSHGRSHKSLAQLFIVLPESEYPCLSLFAPPSC